MVVILDIDNMLDEYEVVSVEELLYENLYKIFYFKGFISWNDSE